MFLRFVLFEYYMEYCLLSVAERQSAGFPVIWLTVTCSLCSGMLFMSSGNVGYWIMHISVGVVQVYWSVLFLCCHKCEVALLDVHNVHSSLAFQPLPVS
jgi:hypothetical protein